jgi:nucleotide-binding universal stress UspA family protein
MLALEQALQIVREDGEVCLFHCLDAEHCLSKEGALPLLQRMQEADIRGMVYIMEGSAAIEIPRFATENKCDVIVMFAGERNEQGELTGKLVMGGVAERVFHATNIPLLLVRA